jgi:hypothetical protein
MRYQPARLVQDNMQQNRQEIASLPDLLHTRKTDMFFHYINVVAAGLYVLLRIVAAYKHRGACTKDCVESKVQSGCAADLFAI